MEKLLYIVIFEALTYMHGKTVMSDEEDLQTISSLRNNSGSRYVENSKFN